MEITIRIDGNPNYTYSKAQLTMVRGDIYVVDRNIDGRLSLHLLNGAYTETIKSNNLKEMLSLAYFASDRVIEAIKECICTGEAIEVKGIQGLVVSDW